jgi:ADP-ribose pyrophosphatase YjhB (NUDIX family)
MWALVGGKWDFGETLAQAVVREVQEETGLETKFTALRGLVNERLASIDTAAPAHFTIFICELQVTAGTAREQKEGAVAWFSMSEIERLSREGRIVPTDYVMIQQFVPAAALPYAEIEVLIDGDGLATIHRIEEMAG